MKMPLLPRKPFYFNLEPKERIETIHSIFPPSNSIKLLEFLNNFCKENKIKIEDIYISDSDSMRNSYDGDGTEIGTEISLFYRTYKPNKNYKSELKKFNKALEIHNDKMALYDILEKKYQKDLVEYQIYHAKLLLASAQKKKEDAEKEDAEKEIAEAKKKLKI